MQVFPFRSIPDWKSRRTGRRIDAAAADGGNTDTADVFVSQLSQNLIKETPLNWPIYGDADARGHAWADCT